MTNWENLFGTPEKAARTVTGTWVACSVGDGRCDICPLSSPDDCLFGNHNALLEWLESEVRDA